MADFFDLIALIQKDHPDIFAILSKPGVLEVALQIVQAEIDHTPWSADQIDAALHATPYYQSTPKAGRTFDTLQALDPATARSQQEQRADQMQAWASSNGMNLSRDAALFTAGVSLSSGFTDQQWQQDIIRNQYSQIASNRMPIDQQLHAAAAQYGVPVSPLTNLDWAGQIMTGQTTMDAFDAYLREQAKSLYPALADAIDAGITVRQYADPYAQIASRELGINPADFDLSDQKWSAPLNQIDPQTGARTAMTLSSWQSHIRSDPIYGYDTTTGARDQAAQFATSLAQQFGAMG